MTKTYIIVGDNNFWYSTYTAKTEREALKELNDVIEKIEAGYYNTFDLPADAESVHLYEAREITTKPITTNGSF